MYTNKHNYLSFIALSLLGALSLGSCADIDSTDATKGNGDGKVLKIIAKVDKPQTRVSSYEDYKYVSEDSIEFSYAEENFKWDSGDEIGIMTSDGKVVGYRNINGGDEFAAISEKLSVPSDGYVRAFYPFSCYSGYGWLDVYDINDTKLFLADNHYVSQGAEQIDLSFTNAATKAYLRTYTDNGATPIEIQPVLYNVSKQGTYYISNNFDPDDFSQDWRYADKWGGSENKDSVIFEKKDNFFSYTDSLCQRNNITDYITYETLFAPQNYNRYWWEDNENNKPVLKYSAYGIFDVEKKINEQMKFGTLYDIMLKVPQQPTINRDFDNGEITIRMFLPKGYTKGVNLDDYEVKLYKDIRCFQYVRPEYLCWNGKLSDMKAIGDTLELTMKENEFFEQGGSFTTYSYWLTIQKKNAENDESLYDSGRIGYTEKMCGKWQGTESFTDQNGISKTITYDNIYISYGAADCPWSCVKNFGDLADGRWIDQLFLCGDELSITFFDNIDTKNEMYELKGKVDNPCNSKAFKGKFIHYVKDNDRWRWDYSHNFEMKRSDDY